MNIFDLNTDTSVTLKGSVVAAQVVDATPVNRWTVHDRKLINASMSDYNFRAMFAHQVEAFDKERINLLFAPYNCLTDIEGPEEDGMFWKYKEGFKIYVYIHASKICNNRYAAELLKSEWVELEMDGSVTGHVFRVPNQKLWPKISIVDDLSKDKYKVFLAESHEHISSGAYINNYGQVDPSDFDHFADGTLPESVKNEYYRFFEVEHIASKGGRDESCDGFHLNCCMFSKQDTYRNFASSLRDAIPIIAGYSSFIGSDNDYDNSSIVAREFKSLPGASAGLSHYHTTKTDTSYQSFDEMLHEAIKCLKTSKIMMVSDAEIETAFAKNVYGSFEVDGEKYEIAKPGWLLDGVFTFNSLLALYWYDRKAAMFDYVQYDDLNQITASTLKSAGRSSRNRYERMLDNPLTFGQLMRVDSEGIRHIYTPEYSLRFKKAVPECRTVIDFVNVGGYYDHMKEVSTNLSRVNFDRFTPIIDHYGESISYDVVLEKMRETAKRDQQFNIGGCIIRMGILGSREATARYFLDRTAKNLETVVKVNAETQYSLFERAIERNEHKDNAAVRITVSSGRAWRDTSGITCFDGRSASTGGILASLAANVRSGRNTPSVEYIGEMLKEIKQTNIKFPGHLHLKEVEISSKNEVVIKLNKPIEVRAFFLDRMAEYLGLARDTIFHLNPDLVANRIEKLDAFKLKLNVRDEKLVITELNRAGPPPSGISVLSHPNIGGNTRVCSGEVANSDLLSFLETLEVINYDSSYNYNLFGQDVCPISTFVREFSDNERHLTAEQKAAKVTRLNGLLEDFAIVPDGLATGIQQATSEEGDEVSDEDIIEEMDIGMDDEDEDEDE